MTNMNLDVIFSQTTGMKIGNNFFWIEIKNLFSNKKKKYSWNVLEVNLVRFANLVFILQTWLRLIFVKYVKKSWKKNIF